MSENGIPLDQAARNFVDLSKKTKLEYESPETADFLAACLDVFYGFVQRDGVDMWKNPSQISIEMPKPAPEVSFYQVLLPVDQSHPHRKVGLFIFDENDKRDMLGSIGVECDFSPTEGHKNLKATFATKGSFSTNSMMQGVAALTYSCLKSITS